MMNWKLVVTALTVILIALIVAMRGERTPVETQVTDDAALQAELIMQYRIDNTSQLIRDVTESTH